MTTVYLGLVVLVGVVFQATGLIIRGPTISMITDSTMDVGIVDPNTSPTDSQSMNSFADTTDLTVSNTLYFLGTQVPKPTFYGGSLEITHHPVDGSCPRVAYIATWSKCPRRNAGVFTLCRSVHAVQSPAYPKLTVSVDDSVRLHLRQAPIEYSGAYSLRIWIDGTTQSNLFWVGFTILQKGAPFQDVKPPLPECLVGEPVRLNLTQVYMPDGVKHVTPISRTSGEHHIHTSGELLNVPHLPNHTPIPTHDIDPTLPDLPQIHPEVPDIVTSERLTESPDTLTITTSQETNIRLPPIDATSTTSSSDTPSAVITDTDLADALVTVSVIPHTTELEHPAILALGSNETSREDQNNTHRSFPASFFNFFSKLSTLQIIQLAIPTSLLVCVVLGSCICCLIRCHKRRQRPRNPIYKPAHKVEYSAANEIAFAQLSQNLYATTPTQVNPRPKRLSHTRDPPATTPKDSHIILSS
ncbi:glycoprotein I [Macropodid alphaherpesvirus 4]|uniref:Envelope glycoprotein I n=1 Tax=Macropodid alphaherpesvirus 4 TaxID=2762721 RepID=A0A7L7YSD4_9ALPH|nr:glycoprotein I [Macropodid alphaherpesvirus 4]QOD40150.1 glycoprotein I [Macropodid alphaherpesvirus 4]